MNCQNPTARDVFLRNVSSRPLPDDMELESRFFHAVRLPNGTAKQTAPHRLDGVADKCNELLSQRERRVKLLDVGISSGVTTLDWMKALGEQGISFQMHGLDICLHAFLITITKFVHILVDSKGRPLQFELAGFALSNHYGETWRMTAKRLIPVTLARAISYLCLAPVRARFTKGDVRANEIKAEQWGLYTAYHVPLVTRGLLDAANVELIELDMMKLDELPDDDYDMIRVANILNKQYFDDRTIRKALDQLKSKLSPDGYVCVVRTDEQGENNGTIFKVNGRSLEPQCRIGSGSEIEDLIC